MFLLLCVQYKVEVYKQKSEEKLPCSEANWGQEVNRRGTPERRQKFIQKFIQIEQKKHIYNMRNQSKGIKKNLETAIKHVLKNELVL